MEVPLKTQKETFSSLLEKARNGELLAMVTAYDYTGASIADEAGVDMLLVGDSLGMVILGHENTLGVTVNDMIYHSKAVVRARKKAFVITDMPFLSYQTGWQDAMRNAGRILAEGGADAVKLEGGRHIAKIIKKLVKNGIPVMGHLGLTPQSSSILNSRLQGDTAKSAWEIYQDAIALQEAGVFSVVLEKIPAELAFDISDHLEIPTIGIGSGNGCDGQVLVFHDLLGIYQEKTFKFVKQYANLKSLCKEAIYAYVNEVKTCAFPSKEHSWNMAADEWQNYNNIKSQEKKV